MIKLSQRLQGELYTFTGYPLHKRGYSCGNISKHCITAPVGDPTTHINYRTIDFMKRYLMNYQEAREELKPRLQDYVEQVTIRSKGQNMYVCPICKSGTGKNHTGAFSVDPKVNRWKCFSCGESGDLFDLIGQVESIADPLAQLKRAGELYGVEVSQGESSPSSSVAQNQPKTEQYTHNSIHTNTYTPTHEEVHTDYTDFFIQANNDIEKTGYHRGLSMKTINRFMLGYVESWKHPKAPLMEASPRLIIPTSKYSYLARHASDSDYINYRGEAENKSKVGRVHFINIEALKTATEPIFIVEGELDALSVIEVGGEAIGLGSVAYINKFIQEVEAQKPKHPLILALDNDESGENAFYKITGELDRLGVGYYRGNIAGDYKDANEALIKDRALLEERVAKAIRYVQGKEEEALEAEREAYTNTSAYNHLQEFINGIAESANTPAQPTGFTRLDEEILEGGLYEGLYIMGAITSAGKTTLALQMADQIADSGRDVLIFSLEMARTELMSKSISRLTLLDVLDNGGDIANAKTNRGITAGARWARYSQTEKDLIQRAITSYGKYAQHIYIHEGVGDIGTDQIREAVQKHERLTGQAPVVIVDYVQILAPYDVRATDKQNTDKAVLELKRISRDFKIPVIGISSFNRASYKEAVTLEAFKESGSLEYGSDVLIGLQLKGAGKKGFDSTEAKDKDPREIELVILKNRNGKTGKKLELEYYPKFNYFREI